MRALWQILCLMQAGQRRSLLRGAALSVLVLVMGVALLGLSGWFITAAAAAGLAGAGAVFDVFRPSAGVRFLALGRTAARYGERMLTHDATLRALQSLRLEVLAGFLVAPWSRVVRLRSSRAVHRLIGDIDALDGLVLRLLLPVLAALLTQALAFLALWWLVDLRMALVVVLPALAGAMLIVAIEARRTAPLSRRMAAAAEAMRMRLIDLIRARDDLAVSGRLPVQAEAVTRAEARRRDLAQILMQRGRNAGAALSLVALVSAAGALWLGLDLAQAGQISPARAALGFFAALALAETLHPLRRACADIGQMRDAARRVVAGRAVSSARSCLKAGPDVGKPLAGISDGQPVLEIRALALRAADGQGRQLLSGFDLRLMSGARMALTGASGSGKSTLLLAIAGLHPFHGQILLAGQPLASYEESTLRQLVTLVPQRPALLAGTIRDNLRLAAPEAPDSALVAALQTVALWPQLQGRGGLDYRLGSRGAGLSGGEGRRLALARAVLRQPRLLLLDEPTEGLDDATARQVLAALCDRLPRTAVLMASHRGAEREMAQQIVALRQ
ncbi:ATP-binding cassette domain-containing protein [Xinfangfangia sp. D13-10-4-6]|uniref:amino acid ABC transporter ATP-binding/permease protein n=1 Tax=Pseudogemmobacter hezensis TaxID=2737662 RepID=UPI001553B568|nr:ATP-binding cassette domain-containing protein [Pseudogemmobacter hezensis]NPD16828.1 ATP-binding cassette domain-containing protein [Pseudogemmobacter hezensis]